MDEQTIPERFPEDIQSVPMLLYFSNNAIAATGYRMFYDIDEKWGNNTTKFVNSYHAVVFILSFSFKNPSIYWNLAIEAYLFNMEAIVDRSIDEGVIEFWDDFTTRNQLEI